MKRKIVALCGYALGVFVLHAPAHAAGQQPYDTGRVMDQVKERPEQPTKKPVTIDLHKETKSPVQKMTGAKIRVKSFRITGATVYSEQELMTHVSGFVEKDMSVPQLQQAAAKISDFYRNKGYFLAYAYLPPQEIADGIVTIAILEGKIDKVVVNKSADTRILSDVVLAGMRGFKNGAVVNKDELENRLLILSDLPGLDVRSELRPGVTTGTTELVLNVQEKSLLTASLDADNYGNRFSGEYRGGVTLNVNDATGRGDQLSVRGATAGDGMMYIKSSYVIPVGNYGTKVGINFSYMNYKLGEEFKDLNQRGESKIVGGLISHPLIVSSNISLYSQLGYDYKMIDDKVLTSVSNKYLNVGNTGLLLNLVDEFAGGGINNASLFLSGGNLNLTGSAQSSDAKSAGGPETNGMYGKTTLNLSRLQSLNTGSTFLNISFDGQVAFKNLDTTEKYSLGGPYGVRAYPVGEANGDDGFVSSVELRQNLVFLKSALPGDVQLTGFYDIGLVRQNHDAYSGSGGSGDTVSRAGAGLGINWGRANDFMIRTSAAWMIGEVPAQISDGTNRKPRLWFQLVKWF